jgi:NAD(P)H-nitrite reductase large subunit
VTHYKYLIIGGGMSADAAVRGIRQLDGEGSIGLIGEEPYPPYDRPPLSKGLWRGDSADDIWRNTQEQELRFTSDSGHRLSSRATDVSPTRGDRFIPSRGCFWLPEADRGVYRSVRIA